VGDSGQDSDDRCVCTTDGRRTCPSQHSTSESTFTHRTFSLTVAALVDATAFTNALRGGSAVGA
jgi:hypothetical protein